MYSTFTVHVESEGDFLEHNIILAVLSMQEKRRNKNCSCKTAVFVSHGLLPLSHGEM